MIVEHNQSSFYDNKYKFNGKELDEATGMYYYGARYYDPRISIFVSVDPLAEQFVGWTPYHYVHQNPINLIDPTGMSAENSDGGGWLNRAWNNVKSIFSSSNDPSTASSPIEHTELDEITINANRKPNWFQRNFSRDKFSRDWKNNKEKSGYNHAANYVEDNRENISNTWNSPLARTAVPDKVGVSLSSSVTAVAGLNVGFNFDWITRGND